MKKGSKRAIPKRKPRSNQNSNATIPKGSVVDKRARSALRKAYGCDDSSERIEFIRSAIAFDENFIEAWNQLGCHEPDPQKAEELFSRAIAIGSTKYPSGNGEWSDEEYSSFSAAITNLAKVREIQCRFDESIELLERVLDKGMPDAPQAMSNLLLLYLQTRRYDKAQEHLDGYVDEESDPDAIVEYSRLLIALNTGASEEECYSLFESAMLTMPEIAEYLAGNMELPASVSIDSYEDVAASVGLILLPAWRATDRPTLWIRSALATFEKNSGFEDDDLSDLDLDELINDALEEDQEDEIWRFETVGFDGKIAYFVMDSETESLIYFWIGRGDADIETAYLVFLLSICEPMEGEPKRPIRLVSSDAGMIQSMNTDLSVLAIEFEWSNYTGRELLLKTAKQMDNSLDEEEFENEEQLSELLEELPLQSEAVFVVAVRQLPTFVEVEGRNVRPYFGFVLDSSDDSIRSQLLSPKGFESLQIKKLLGNAMLSPMIGDSMRPGSIEFSDPDSALCVKDWLKGLGISTAIGTSYEETIDRLMEMLIESEDQSRLPSVTEIDGADDAILEEFYESSREYFLAEPWTVVPEANLLEVQPDESNDLILYCAVMGQLGEVKGLSIFASFEDFIRARESGLDGDENAESVIAVSLLFNEDSEIHPSDLDFIENGGIPIAGAFAYPAILTTDLGEANQCDLEQIKLMVTTIRILVAYFSQQTFKIKAELGKPHSVEWSCGNDAIQAKVTFRNGFS
jgi:tetratricopeptide (TPR) repeat protein